MLSITYMIDKFARCCILSVWLICLFSPQAKNKPWLPWVYSWIRHRRKHLQSTAPCLLPTIHCPLPLFPFPWPLFTAQCLLAPVYCQSPTVHCKLITVYCLSAALTDLCPLNANLNFLTSSRPAKISGTKMQWRYIQHAQWTVGSGQWTTVTVQWSVDRGQWDWVKDSGQWTVDSGQWIEDSGQ
jgi:hypothetical protein